MCHIIPFSWKKSAAFDTFCIYQNDYNNTVPVFGDKMYHMTIFFSITGFNNI